MQQIHLYPIYIFKKVLKVYGVPKVSQGSEGAKMSKWSRGLEGRKDRGFGWGEIRDSGEQLF